MSVIVCAACLSQRNTSPLRSLLHVFLSIVADSNVTEETPVCWECEGFLKRCLRFRTRARRAHLLLSRVHEVQDPIRIQSLSSLTVANECDNDTVVTTQYASDVELQPNQLESCEPASDADISANLEEPSSDTKRAMGRKNIKEVKPKAWIHIKSGERLRKVPVFDEDLSKDLSGSLLVGCETEGRLRRRKKERADKKRGTSLEQLKREIEKEKKKVTKTENAHFKCVRVSEEVMRALREEERQRAQYVGSQYKCERCILGYYTEQQLLDHRAFKHTPKAGHVECNVCGSYVREECAPGHRDNHYTLFECRACPYRHRVARHMWAHARRAHPPRAQQYQCPQCDQVFTSSTRRRYHVETRHKHPEPINCEYCGKSYRGLAVLRTHIRNTHCTRTRVQCETCGRTYLGAANMRAHARLAHRAASPPRPACAPCGVTFKNEETYKTHLKTSRNHVAPQHMKYKCSVCEKGFAVKRSLQEHYEARHSFKTNACLQCDKTYSSVRALRYHERRAHSNVERVRDKVCEHCGKTFYSAKALRIHTVVHSDRRPYVCTVCDASFRFHSALYKHNQIKHGRVKSDVECAA